MSRRIAIHLRSNLVGYVALFAALSGTAIALPGKGKIDRNDLKAKVVATKHLRGEAVTTGKIGDGAVTSGKLGDGAVTSAKLGGGAVTVDKLNGTALDSLPGAIGRSAQGPGLCADDDGFGTDCAEVSVTLPQSARVLLVSGSHWYTSSFDDIAGGNQAGDDTDETYGTCTLRADGTTVSGTLAEPGELMDANANLATPSWTIGSGTSFNGGSLALTGVTPLLAAGAHTFALHCTEEDGDIDWSRATISAVVLGDA